MTKIEELQHIVELLKKHDLPLSPILEYAIKEREDLYIQAYAIDTPDSVLCEPQPEFIIYKELEDYIKEFGSLSVGISNGKKLPHKAILLLGIMHLIETGVIEENQIPLDNSISKAFSSCWSRYFVNGNVPSVWIPFWYMKSEPFWHFRASHSDEQLRATLSFAGHPSVGQMRAVIRYAYFDEQLFSFMKDTDNRQLLKDILMDTYVHNFYTT